jgi:hypothetical protein
MFQKIEYKIKGIAPLVMHNVRLADPLDPFTREVKRLTAAAKKTDDGAAALSRVEWSGGMYHTMGEIEIKDGVVSWDKRIRPIIPSDMIMACVVDGAKKAKLGKQALAGIMVPDDAILEYDGPKDLNALMADAKHRLCKVVAVQRNRVMRTRPIFRSWSATIALEVNPELLNDEQVTQAVMVAGRQCGMGDWRPKHGRFEVVG